MGTRPGAPDLLGVLRSRRIGPNDPGGSDRRSGSSHCRAGPCDADHRHRTRSDRTPTICASSPPRQIGRGPAGEGRASRPRRSRSSPKASAISLPRPPTASASRRTGESRLSAAACPLPEWMCQIVPRRSIFGRPCSCRKLLTARSSRCSRTGNYRRWSYGQFSRLVERLPQRLERSPIRRTGDARIHR
jgi:hypothetical protein